MELANKDEWAAKKQIVITLECKQSDGRNSELWDCGRCGSSRGSRYAPEELCEGKPININE